VLQRATTQKKIQKNGPRQQQQQGKYRLTGKNGQHFPASDFTSTPEN
jgi:hypothetical protein